jgi:competence protein ComFC
MKNLISKIVACVVFPPVCYGCGDFGAQLCSKCVRDLEKIKNYICLTCGRNIETLGECRCGASDRVYSAWQYKGATRKALFECKYKGHKEAVAQLLAHMRPSQVAMMMKMTTKINNPIIVPVPLHKKRVKQRGFDQNSLIARIISQMIGVGVIEEGALLRRVDTKTQTTMKTKEDRERNVFGAFSVERPELLIDKTAIIVDDILTTGATIKSLSDSIYPYTRTKSSAITIAHEGVRI